MYSVHDVFRGPGLSIHYRQTGRATRNLNPTARSPRSIRRLRDCRAAQVPVGAVLVTGLDRDSIEMREVSPMGGLLPQDERQAALREERADATRPA